MQDLSFRTLLVKFFTLMLLIIIFTGCEAFQYAEGNKCLENGDFENAVILLSKAEKVCPQVSKLQNQLANAYLGCGNIEQAWYHSQLAVLFEDPDRDAWVTFLNLYEICVVKKGLLQKGTLIEDVLCQLGDPNLREEGKDMIGLLYGRLVMQFQDSKLINHFFSMLPGE